MAGEGGGEGGGGRGLPGPGIPAAAAGPSPHRAPRGPGEPRAAAPARPGRAGPAVVPRVRAGRRGRGRDRRRGGRVSAAAAVWPHLLRDGRVAAAAAAPRVAGAERGRRRRLGLHVPVEERGPLRAAAAAQRRHLGSKRWGEGGGGGSRVPAAGTPPAATRSGKRGGGIRGASADPGQLPAARATGTSRPARDVTQNRRRGHCAWAA